MRGHGGRRRRGVRGVGVRGIGVRGRGGRAGVPALRVCQRRAWGSSSVQKETCSIASPLVCTPSCLSCEQ